MFLRYENNHYDIIETITAFLGHNGYCYHCLTPYEERRFHKCKYLWSHCEEYHLDMDNNNEKGMKCRYCHRTFPNQTCYDTHNFKANGKPICYYVRLCPQCGVKIDRRSRKSKHVCGEHYCKLCNIHVDETHSCFVKPTKPKRIDNFLYIVFDVETMLLEMDENGEREHQAN